MIRAWLAALVCLFVSGFALAQTPTVTRVKTPVASVYREPSPSSEQVTQVLQGDEVRVTRVEGGWAEVLVVDQYRTPEGYPGWLRVDQLERENRQPGRPTVSVAYPVANLREEPSVDAAVTGKAYLATRLVPAGDSRRIDGEEWLEVELPEGRETAWIRSAQVKKEQPLDPDEGVRIVDKARLFEGTPYLWGGMTRDGIDCSGLVYTVYRIHGLTVPRDADQQYLVGSKVARKDLAPGDLVFFGSPGEIVHVGLYAGGGNFVHASSGGGVMVSPLFQGWYLEHYQGARRVIESGNAEPRKLEP